MKRPSPKMVRSGVMSPGFATAPFSQEDPPQSDHAAGDQMAQLAATPAAMGGGHVPIGRPAQMSEDQAKQLLRDLDYSKVSEVVREGALIHAKGNQGGEEVNLRIDTDAGTVTQDPAGN